MNQESGSLQPIQEETLDENGEAIVKEVASRPSYKDRAREHHLM